MSDVDLEIENTLRPAFTKCFKALTGDVSEAVQLQRVLDELTRASRTILADLVDDWHLQHDLIRRLPNEIIARCFECLPFRDRVRVPHVSRGWRLIALAHRAVWVDIDLRARFNDKTALLELTLARAGQLPVAIRGCPEPVRPGSVGNILAAHISHIKHLDFPRRVSAALLSEPAPQLQSLHIQINCKIREDFLGGRAGQLHTLKLKSVIFSSTCPALSTVTHLTLHPPFEPEHAATYKPLFRLFPALRSLSLLELEQPDRALVFEGPAPASLRDLVLETSQTHFDVSECYEHWASIAPNVSRVTIDQYTAPTRHLRHLLSGAVGLIVGNDDSFTQTNYNVITVGPGERRRTLNFWSTSDQRYVVVQTLLDLRSSLAGVISFDITSAPLVGLLAVLPALPNLAHLTVTYEFDDTQRTEHCFPGNAVALLSRIPEHCPELQSISIRVERHGRPPMFAVAALLAELKALAHVKLPDILVRGITTVEVLCMQIPLFDGFRIIFETPHSTLERDCGST